MASVLYEIEVLGNGQSLLLVDCRCADDEHAIKYAPKRANKLVRKYRDRGDEIADWATDWTVRRALGYCKPVLGRGSLEAMA